MLCWCQALPIEAFLSPMSFRISREAVEQPQSIFGVWLYLANLSASQAGFLLHQLVIRNPLCGNRCELRERHHSRWHGGLSHQLICVLWTFSSPIQDVPFLFYNRLLLGLLDIIFCGADRIQLMTGSLAYAQLIFIPCSDGLSLLVANSMSIDIFQMVYFAADNMALLQNPRSLCWNSLLGAY